MEPIEGLSLAGPPVIYPPRRPSCGRATAVVDDFRRVKKVTKTVNWQSFAT
jgi:hypothetical protein